MIIYKCTNKINGKAYIGQTIKALEERIKGHSYETVRGVRRPFYNALRKYGFENFTWEILDESTEIREILNSLERFYIKKFNTLVPNGYNLAPGGEGNGGCLKGRERPEEAKANMRKPHGPQSDEHKRRLKQANIGKHCSSRKSRGPHKLDCMCASCQSKRGHSLNSGRICIHNFELKINKIVRPEEVQRYLDLGYQLGMIRGKFKTKALL
jgi:group I intron endonuclease